MMSCRRDKCLVATLMATLVLSACSPSKQTRRGASPRPAASETRDPVREEIQRTVVDPLASALRKGDYAKLQNLLSSDITTLDREEILDAVSGASGFKLEKLSMMLTEGERFSRDEVFPSVGGAYRVAGLAPSFSFRANLPMKRADGRWRISGFGWVAPPAWAAPGPFIRTRTDTAVIIHHAGFPAAELGHLVSEAGSKLKEKVPHVQAQYLVVIPRDSEGFREFGGGTALAAVLTSFDWTGSGFKITAPYLVVDPKEFVEAGAEQRRQIVVHEMTHAILTPVTMPFAPVWLVEGIAVFYSGDLGLEVFKEEPQRLDRTSLPDLTRSVGFGDYDLFGERTAIEYAFSAATVAYLMESFGEKATLAFLVSYKDALDPEEIEKRSPIFGGALANQFMMRDLGEIATDRLLEKTWGLTTESLDKAVKDWVRKR